MTDRLKPLLAILGAYQLALGTFMIVAPGTFFEKIGPYGIQNDHYTRDAATFTLALGLVLLIAAWRPGWRAPAIAGARQPGRHAAISSTSPSARVKVAASRV